MDDAYGEVASLNVLIRPDGWTIPENLAELHGTTTEKAEECGIPALTAFAAFSQIARRADQIVAHNINFDRQMLALEMGRLERPDVVASKPQFCTMNATTGICKIRKAHGFGYKWPKLIEAYRHFFGEDFDGAHDALVDVRACHRVHAHLLSEGLVTDTI